MTFATRSRSPRHGSSPVPSTQNGPLVMAYARWLAGPLHRTSEWQREFVVVSKEAEQDLVGLLVLACDLHHMNQVQRVRCIARRQSMRINVQRDRLFDGYRMSSPSESSDWRSSDSVTRTSMLLDRRSKECKCRRRFSSLSSYAMPYQPDQPPVMALSLLSTYRVQLVS